MDISHEGYRGALQKLLESRGLFPGRKGHPDKLAPLGGEAFYFFCTGMQIPQR
jgi:hypothetical protein